MLRSHLFALVLVGGVILSNAPLPGYPVRALAQQASVTPTTIGFVMDADGGTRESSFGPYARTKRRYAVEAARAFLEEVFGAEAVEDTSDVQAQGNGFVINYNNSIYFNGIEKDPTLSVAPAVTYLSRDTDELNGYLGLADDSGDRYSIPLSGAGRTRDAMDRAIEAFRLFGQHDSLTLASLASPSVKDRSCRMSLSVWPRERVAKRSRYRLKARIARLIGRSGIFLAG